MRLIALASLFAVGLSLASGATATATVGASTTRGVQQNQTLSTGSTSVSAFSGEGSPTSPGVESAQARIDLLGGSLRVQASSTPGAIQDVLGTGFFLLPNSISRASAELKDRLTFANAALAAGAATLSMTIDGRFGGAPATNWTQLAGRYPAANLFANLRLTDVASGTVLVQSSFELVAPWGRCPFVGDPSCLVGESFPAVTLSVPIPSIADRSQVDVRAFLGTSATSGEISDFFSTAVLGIELPRGVTYSSSLGVVLTPIPEPSTGLLLLAGLPLLLARRRLARC